ncbi:MAG TPA: TonB family protein [Terriglobia bacterium]|nr:TonB family protein [Terriglobia bacterium]
MRSDSQDDLNLLVELEPDSARWRFLAIYQLCLLGHVALLGLILLLSSMITRHEKLIALATAEEKPPQPTFLVLPRDLQAELEKERRAKLQSDQDRLARSKPPIVNPQAPHEAYSKGNTKLPEIAGGQPKPPAPPPQPQPQPAAPKQQAAAAPPPPPPQHDDTLKLEDVPKPAQSPGHLAMATPQEMLDQAAQAAARGRAHGRVVGPGDSIGQFNNPSSNFSLEGPMILSDTQGVDFGPYLARIVRVVRENWYAVMPESARLGEKGRVAIQFAILRDGRVPELDLVLTSGSQALDGAAGAALHASIPFPPLPNEYRGNDLKLRFIFLYNLGYGAQ